LRYDACVIGAGADGLAAASMLARAGLKTIVVERGEHPGGRIALGEFHPGFHASPFCDEIAPIPAEIFRALDLARKGAIFAPAFTSRAVWADRAHVLRPNRPSPESGLLRRAARVADDARLRAGRDAEPAPRKPLFAPTPVPAPWPGEDWLGVALADLVAGAIDDRDAAAHVMALALQGRAADPFLRGSALHLLAPGHGGSGLVVGRLADALAAAAREAGAEIVCGVEATDIRQAKERVCAVGLADGTQIETRAVLSTLDLKRTFLSLFPWDKLPKPVARRVGALRMAGSTARLLLALDSPPELDAQTMRAPLHIAPDPARMAQAHAAWRSGVVPEHPPMTLRVVSASDPALAPAGQAVLTATLGGIPSRLFDGAWTHEKRDALRSHALAAIEGVLPGVTARVIGTVLLVPPDIEEALSATDGDLWGGEIAADQMFGLRPGFDTACPRTPMEGLYLAGPSSAAGQLGTCASGTIAASAMIADLNSGRRK
jgi:phytoene dehydrogenase-like protein